MKFENEISAAEALAISNDYEEVDEQGRQRLAEFFQKVRKAAAQGKTSVLYTGAGIYVNGFEQAIERRGYVIMDRHHPDPERSSGTSLLISWADAGSPEVD